MTIELCDRCCKQIDENNKYEFYVPTELTDDGKGKVYNNHKMFLCYDCAKKFVETVNTFKDGYTKERIKNIQALNLF